jgi:hypothetical protein
MALSLSLPLYMQKDNKRGAKVQESGQGAKKKRIDWGRPGPPSPKKKKKKKKKKERFALLMC